MLAAVTSAPLLAILMLAAVIVNKMKKVSVNGRIGLTTSVIPHRNGKYPIWFENSDDVEFIDSKNVVFI